VSKTYQYRITSPVEPLKEKIVYKTAFTNILKSDMVCDRSEQAMARALVLNMSKDI
jgi:hypothetical protein